MCRFPWTVKKKDTVLEFIRAYKHSTDVDYINSIVCANAPETLGLPSCAVPMDTLTMPMRCMFVNTFCRRQGLWSYADAKIYLKVTINGEDEDE
jgi:hypothetical protein